MATRHKKRIRLYFFFLLTFLLFLTIGVFAMGKAPVQLTMRAEESTGKTLWQYQCIDTMKTSRDRARNWQTSSDAHSDPARQVRAIKSLGANCVAIDTPYDKEFLPFLKIWVREARANNLHIWFRGNFSSWEGWFDYPKGMSQDALFTKTTSFITENPELFKDGDIFTPAPEGENGGPFNQVEIDEHESYRTFLLAEEKITKDAFVKIGKKVEINWMSMNGGLAKRMFDQQTIDGLGKVVTLDHYIKTAPEMGEFIDYFAKKYNARTIIGEFGAPIPEINGEMTEEDQANFVDSLFRELYKRRDSVIGVNYWVLYDSSTALYNPDFTPRKVAAVVRKYFNPNIINGKVVDEKGKAIPGASVKIVGASDAVHTDSKGRFSFITPDDKVMFYATDANRTPVQKEIKLDKKKTSVKLVLRSEQQSLFEKFKEFLRMK